jgi:hypothetical protein
MLEENLIGAKACKPLEICSEPWVEHRLFNRQISLPTKSAFALNKPVLMTA